MELLRLSISCRKISCECDFFENEVCLEDVWDGDEVSGGVKHHASVRKVWRVLNLRERLSRLCEIFKAFSTWTSVARRNEVDSGSQTAI